MKRLLAIFTITALFVTPNAYSLEMSCVEAPKCSDLGYNQSAEDCADRKYTVCPYDSTAYSCDTTTCEELGYDKTSTQCAGKVFTRCPFDKNLYSCDTTSCEDMGFTDKVAECPGEYDVCQYDKTKGKCIYEARPGDLKYSWQTNDHNGWMLCNGRSFSSTRYPDLYAAIAQSTLPNYIDYFIKGTTTLNKNNFKTYETAGLPNITGIVGYFRGDNTSAYTTKSGAFSEVTTTSSKDNSYTGYSGAFGAKITFDASKSSSIYGRSDTVTPQNYKANIFIYAGKTSFPSYSDDLPKFNSCAIGDFIYKDGSCSTKYISSKTLLGIVETLSQGSSPAKIFYIWGGTTCHTGNLESLVKIANEACKASNSSVVGPGELSKLAKYGWEENPIVKNITSENQYIPSSTDENPYECSGTRCEYKPYTTKGCGWRYYCSGTVDYIRKWKCDHCGKVFEYSSSSITESTCPNCTHFDEKGELVHNKLTLIN